MIRVGYVISDLRLGGAERLLESLIRLWRLERAPITPFVYALKDGPVSAALRREGASVALLPGDFHLNPLAVPWLWRRFRRDDIEIAHLQLPRAAFYGRLAAASLRLPVLYTEHSLWESHRGMTRVLDRFTYSLNDRVVTVSNAVSSSVGRHVRFPPERILCLRNGILPREDIGPSGRPAARASLGLPPEALVIGTIANFRPSKGHPRLIEAMAEVARSFPEAYCVMAGRDEGELAGLERIARDLAIESRLKFLEGSVDARPMLSAFDVFALPSLQEGLPLALLEAMDAGLPVVATKTGGIPEAIEEGRTGRLVEPGDAAALARALIELLSDPGERAALGAAAKAKVRDQFDLRGTADGYLSIYRSLLEARR